MPETKSEYETVYGKYKVIEAKTGAEKHGKYFVLKLDTVDQEEREAVFAALAMYAYCQATAGHIGYAEAVMRYVESERGRSLKGVKDEDKRYDE